METDFLLNKLSSAQANPLFVFILFVESRLPKSAKWIVQVDESLESKSSSSSLIYRQNLLSDRQILIQPECEANDADC